MQTIVLYSVLLIFGMVASQVIDLHAQHDFLNTLTMICLAYIMIEVGLEFIIDKKNLRLYGKDYLIAFTAATFPWIFCSFYFMYVLDAGWKEAWLIGRFAAPTSAGVLFAMLAAAGLASTWLFKRARVLAIFDDLDTVLLMIPLQIMIVGVKHEFLAIIVIILLLLAVAYRWLHELEWPIGTKWMLLYSVVIVLVCELIEHSTEVHLEVLLPAFALGCLLFNPHLRSHTPEDEHEHEFLEPAKGWSHHIDKAIKAGFMLLVGLSFPEMTIEEGTWKIILMHVLIITVLSNLGKCFPSFCYKKDASLKERIALSVALFPRGEVGAGILIVAMNYGFKGTVANIAGLSLALNLVLTGVFIAIVNYLIRDTA